MSISINVPSLPSIDDNDLPKSLLLKKFDLQMLMIRCDIQFRSMPNLHRFVFTIIVDKNISPFTMDLINGQNWREMLTCHVPYLNKFDFHMSLLTNDQPIDLDNILNSFRPFINLYEKWDMRISRWKFMPYVPYLPLFPSFSLVKKDDDDSKKYLDNLSRLVNLSNISNLQFSRNNDITRLHVIEHVLLACPNVTELIITLHILIDNMHFPSKYASTIVQCYRSLTFIEIDLYSTDIAVPIADIFLRDLEKLRFIIIHCRHNSLLDNPFSRNYIMEKRHQSFSVNKNDDDRVVAKFEDQTLSIRLP
ncbi:unnamed protein product [Rotaria socialis]|uniref:Uncharacterized protein n=1 Tax=Rotaria socialis TaxID=392032 RepID=A0A821G7M7_9BILA|nr:unnamed protein product [Rotaria socialis]